MNAATPFLYAAILCGSVASGCLIASQILRFKESFEPSSQAVQPRKVNIRQ